MDTGLFPIDVNFLSAVARLRDEANVDFKIVTDKISEVSDATDQNNLHGFPDTNMNYPERFHTLLGFGIALSILKNIFLNPEQLLVELREQEDFLEAQERARKEEG